MDRSKVEVYGVKYAAWQLAKLVIEYKNIVV